MTQTVLDYPAWLRIDHRLNVLSSHPHDVLLLLRTVARSGRTVRAVFVKDGAAAPVIERVPPPRRRAWPWITTLAALIVLGAFAAAPTLLSTAWGNRARRRYRIPPLAPSQLIRFRK